MKLVRENLNEFGVGKDPLKTMGLGKNYVRPFPTNLNMEDKLDWVVEYIPIALDKDEIPKDILYTDPDILYYIRRKLEEMGYTNYYNSNESLLEFGKGNNPPTTLKLGTESIKELFLKAVSNYNNQLEKAKYIKREGSPGNYKYYYTEAELKEAHKEQESKEGKKTENKQDKVKVGKYFEEIKGLKLNQSIPIDEDAKYSGKDMDWTETFTGVKKIGKGGEWVTHKSNSPIKAFKNKETCFSPKEHSSNVFKDNSEKNKEVENLIDEKKLDIKKDWRKYIYAAYIPEGTEIDTYGNDEYRLDLNKDIKIKYVGYEQDVWAGVNNVKTLNYTVKPEDESIQKSILGEYIINPKYYDIIHEFIGSYESYYDPDILYYIRRKLEEMGYTNYYNSNESLLEFGKGNNPMSTMKIGMMSIIETWFEENYEDIPEKKDWIYELLNTRQIDAKQTKEWVEFLISNNFNWNIEENLYALFEENNIKVFENVPVGFKTKCSGPNAVQPYLNDVILTKTEEGLIIEFVQWEDFTDFFKHALDFIQTILAGDGYEYFDNHESGESESDLQDLIIKNQLKIADNLKSIYEKLGGNTELELEEILEEIFEDEQFSELKEAIKHAGNNANGIAELDEAYNYITNTIINYYDLTNINSNADNIFHANISTEGAIKLICAEYDKSYCIDYDTNHDYYASIDPNVFIDELENALSEINID